MSGFWSARLGLVQDVLARHVSSGAVPGAVGLLARGGSEHVFAVGDVGRGGRGLAFFADSRACAGHD